MLTDFVIQYGAHESSFAPPISSTTGSGAKVADYGTGSHTSSHHTGAAATGAAAAGTGAAAYGHHENKHAGSGHTGSHSHDTSGNHGVVSFLAFHTPHNH